MSCTFYLLPSRAEAALGFAGYLGQMFPGLDWTRTPAADMADVLAELVERRDHVFVIYQEDLTAEGQTDQQLADLYGAEEGDWVVTTGGPAGSQKSWRVGPVTHQDHDDGEQLPAAA